MTVYTMDRIAEQRADHLSKMWHKDKRLLIISNGLTRKAVAKILGSMRADLTSKPTLFGATKGHYRIEHDVLCQISGFTAESFANDVARALGRILQRDVEAIAYSEVDEEGYITFTYITD
jgi:hypothetical protein